MGIQTIAYSDPQALADGACALALEKIAEALATRERAVIILSGGTTPRETYRLLARGIREQNMPVSRLLWVLGDERWVTTDSPASNEGMARASLFDPIGAPAETVLSWNAGRGDPMECAARYTERVRDALAGSGADLAFLGMGADGHTASLFPDGVVHLSAQKSMPVGPTVPGIAAAVRSESAGGWRLTLCPQVFREAGTVAYLVAGDDKAAALRRARDGDASTPAGWVRGRATLFLTTRNALGPEAVDFGRDVRHA